MSAQQIHARDLEFTLLAEAAECDRIRRKHARDLSICIGLCFAILVIVGTYSRLHGTF